VCKKAVLISIKFDTNQDDIMAHKLDRGRCKPESGQHFTIGNTIYELRGKIGDGAVGLVRKANPIGGGPTVAIKLLAPDPRYIDSAHFEDVSARFKREGERGTHLDHPNLLQILSYCENLGGSAFKLGKPLNPFLLMEFMEGKTLESYIRHTPEGERNTFQLSQSRLSIAIQICQGLEYLKHHRLVHRDIKPSNIFLRSTGRSQRYQVKLGDFGVVKWGDFHAAVATGTLTVTTQKGIGTLKYMSPEQAVRPKTVTWKSDIWSLGITLFELFTGQILASAHHVYEIQAARRTQGTTWSRFLGMECKLPHENGEIAELVLDMFLAADGRPAIDRIRGRLETEYERRFQTTWKESG
jgi:eukaryotic-like serine/threonine-protein kinase